MGNKCKHISPEAHEGQNCQENSTIAVTHVHNYAPGPHESHLAHRVVAVLGLVDDDWLSQGHTPLTVHLIFVDVMARNWRF